MNTKFKFILSSLFLLLLLLGNLACQRNNMPYGGVKSNDNPPYTQEFDINSQKK